MVLSAGDLGRRGAAPVIDHRFMHDIVCVATGIQILTQGLFVAILPTYAAQVCYSDCVRVVREPECITLPDRVRIEEHTLQKIYPFDTKVFSCISAACCSQWRGCVSLSVLLPSRYRAASNGTKTQ